MAFFSRRGLFRRVAESAMAVPVAATVAQARFKDVKAEAAGEAFSAEICYTTAEPVAILSTTYPPPKQ